MTPSESTKTVEDDNWSITVTTFTIIPVLLKIGFSKLGEVVGDIEGHDCIKVLFELVWNS